MPNGRIVVLSTRWNEEDLIGHVLQEAKENPNQAQWDVLSIPAILDEPASRMLGYPMDETFWPEVVDAWYEWAQRGVSASALVHAVGRFIEHRYSGRTSASTIADNCRRWWRRGLAQGLIGSTTSVLAREESAKPHTRTP